MKEKDVKNISKLLPQLFPFSSNMSLGWEQHLERARNDDVQGTMMKQG